MHTAAKVRPRASSHARAPAVSDQERMSGSGSGSLPPLASSGETTPGTGNESPTNRKPCRYRDGAQCVGSRPLARHRPDVLPGDQAPDQQTEEDADQEVQLRGHGHPRLEAVDRAAGPTRRGRRQASQAASANGGASLAAAPAAAGCGLRTTATTAATISIEAPATR